MANYETLKAAIQSAIKQNGNNEITGALLQQSLISMINSLGTGYQFLGVAVPSTNPGTPDQKSFYIAVQSGVYSNFNSVEVFPNEMALLAYDSAWTKISSYNIHNVNLSYSGYINVEGQLVETPYWKASDYIPVYPGMTLKMYGRFGGSNNLYVAYYDENKVFFQSPTNTGSGYQSVELTVPGGVFYMRANVQNDAPAYVIIADSVMDAGGGYVKAGKRIPIVVSPTVISGINTQKITASNTASNVALNNRLSEVSQSGYNVVTYPVAKGDIIIRNITDTLATYYATIAFYDADGQPLWRLRGGADTVALQGKAFIAPESGTVKVTISSSALNNGEGIIKVGGETELANGCQAITTIFPDEDVVEEVAQVNPSVGIFDATGFTAYNTSDYLELTGQELILLAEDGLSTSFDYLRFYNADHEQIFRLKGGRKGAYTLQYPAAAKYVRWIVHTSPTIKLYKYKAQPNSGITDINDYLKKGESIAPATHTMLWLGTSIPEGSPYPQNAAARLGWTCFNKALGSSGLVKHEGYLGNQRDGRDLAETTAEKIARYTPYIGQQFMTQEIYDRMVAQWGFEKQIIPYIDGTTANCDVIVFDHGYNDRNATEFANAIENFDTLDMAINKADSAFDRSTFVGAFCYLVKKIWAVNPNIKICICSYLEAQTGSPKYPTDPANHVGYLTCELLKKIAQNFGFPYLPMCDYNGFSIEFVPGTSQGAYPIVNLSGLSNPDNNISLFQYYCPDGVHPHTDTSGRSTERLTQSITKLLLGL